MKKIFYLIVTLCLIIGCEEKEEILQSGFKAGDFPISVGNWWRYKVVDNNGGTTDTLFLSVVNRNENADYYCEILFNQTKVDSALITIGDDLILYKGLNKEYSYFGDFKLVFPVEEGDKWEAIFPGDTAVVLGIRDEFPFNGVTYDSIYSVKRNFNSFGYNLTHLMFISPGVGIVSQSIDLFDGGVTQKQSFELIDFNLE